MGFALQMTWQPSLLHQKRKPGPPLGLRNLGNTCYLNSVLQCLTYTPPLANFCLKYLHSSSCDTAKVSAGEKKTECAFCMIEKRIARSLSIEAALDSPVKINNCLKIFAEHFRHGRQEDAHEFLRYVIDACHNTCLRIKKLQQQRRKGGNSENGICSRNGNGHTVVKEIFGGALQSQVKCLSCGAESNKVDEMMDISLDVLHCGSLKEALQRFFQPEILDGSNKYKCENCKKLVAARKQMSILQAPNVLVIQLKRFEGIFGGKIDKSITFDEVLVLSSYMCKTSQDPNPEYNLFGTIVHSGFSADTGHYYAYIKDAMGRWYCCNDSFVSLSTLKEVLSEKVYILFFSRTKQRPAPPSAVFAVNGTKSNESNGSHSSKISSNCNGDHTSIFPIESKGSHTSKFFKSNGSHMSYTPKLGCLEKPVARKQSSDPHSQIQKTATSKANKGLSTLPRKPSVSENDINKRSPKPSAGNIRIFVHKREVLEKNDHLVGTEANENTVRSVVDRNGIPKNDPGGATDAGKNKLLLVQSVIDQNCVGKSESVDAIDAGRKSPSLANGNSKLHRTVTDALVRHLHEGKDCSKTLTTRRPEEATGDRGSADNSGLKRKLQDEDGCILLVKDAKSQNEVEEFKEVIGREASSFLRSCGWSDKVYHYMQSRKKFCSQQVGCDASNNLELKRLLIADARSTFISKIPESFKGNLIERLKSFNQEKQSSVKRIVKRDG